MLSHHQFVLYVFYEVANSYEFVRPCLYNFVWFVWLPQWRADLGAGLGVGHSNKFIRIVQLVKYVF